MFTSANTMRVLCLTREEDTSTSLFTPSWLGGPRKQQFLAISFCNWVQAVHPNTRPSNWATRTPEPGSPPPTSVLHGFQSSDQVQLTRFICYQKHLWIITHTLLSSHQPYWYTHSGLWILCETLVVLVMLSCNQCECLLLVLPTWSLYGGKLLFEFFLLKTLCTRTLLDFLKNLSAI